MAFLPHQVDPLLKLLALKQVQRKGWTRYPINISALESVADHSYGLALLCWLLCPPDLDRAKVLELALLHDLAEVVTGDLTPQDVTDQDAKSEAEYIALGHLLAGWERRETGLSSLQEYHSQSTPESRFVRQMDKLEMALQSIQYEQQFALDLSEFRRSALEKLEELGLGWLLNHEKSDLA